VGRDGCVRADLALTVSSLSPSAARGTAIPTTMMYFTAYDTLKRRYFDPESPLTPLFAGALARSALAMEGKLLALIFVLRCVILAGAVTVVSPVEMIRTKMQAYSLLQNRPGTITILSFLPSFTASES
jgi:hypothetical protein